jgi:hypothetical protein
MGPKNDRLARDLHLVCGAAVKGASGGTVRIRRVGRLYRRNCTFVAANRDARDSVNDSSRRFAGFVGGWSYAFCVSHLDAFRRLLLYTVRIAPFFATHG